MLYLVFQIKINSKAHCKTYVEIQIISCLYFTENCLSMSENQYMS